MNVSWRLAWRNLWRNPRRTWLTASAIAFITLLMVFLITLQLGSYDLMVDSSLRIFTSHMQVQRAGYLDKPKLRTLIPEVVDLAERLRGDPALRGVAIAARAQGFALASSGTRSYGVQVIGVETGHEPRVSTIPGLVKHGRFLSETTAQETVLGAALAKNLNIAVGDELTLLGSALDGSVAATIVPVVGIFESGMRELDRAIVQLPLGVFQELFGLEDGGHAIALLAPDIDRLAAMQAAATRHFPREPDLVVLEWDRLIPGLKQLIQADWTTGWFTYIALIVVVTFSILNTFIMSVIERTREFGVMLALGATPWRIGSLVMVESALLAFLGLAIGVGLGLLVAGYFAVYGFTYPGLEELMGQYGLPGLIYPKFTVASVLLGPAVILTFVLIAAIYPATRIRRLQPVEAMHAV